MLCCKIESWLKMRICIIQYFGDDGHFINVNTQGARQKRKGKMHILWTLNAR